MFRDKNIFAVKFKDRLDADKLKEDAAIIKPWMVKEHHQQPLNGAKRLRDGAESYHTGGWKGVNLDFRNKYFFINIIPGLRDIFEKSGKAVALQHFSYISTALSWFKSPVIRCRILILESGHKINPHVGNGEEKERVRYLIPMKTHPEVVYYIEDKTFIPEEGEIWYLNQTKTHWVENNSPIDRFTLVVDTYTDAWVEEIFSSGTYI